MFQRLCLLQNAFNQTSKTVEMTRALLILRLRGFVVGGLKRERDMVQVGAPCLCAKYSKPSLEPAFCHIFSESMIDSKRLWISSQVTIWRSTVYFVVHRLIKVTRLENLYMLIWSWRLCGLCACGVRVFNIQSNRQTVPPVPTNTLTKRWWWW